jgi:hypothetical protein
MRKEPGETREWETLKATAEKLGLGRRNRRVTEKMGGCAVNITATEILGIGTVAAKKGLGDLREKKKKASKRPKTNSEEYQNMTICKKAHVRPIHSSKLEE